MARLIDKSIPRFLLVGVLNTLVGAGVMFLLYNAAGWPYWAATASNYLAGGVLSYFLNKYFTFRNRERSWAQVGRFALTVRCAGWSPTASPSPWRSGFLPARASGFRRTRPCWRACASTRGSTTSASGSLRSERRRRAGPVPPEKGKYV